MSEDTTKTSESGNAKAGASSGTSPSTAATSSANAAASSATTDSKKKKPSVSWNKTESNQAKKLTLEQLQKSEEVSEREMKALVVAHRWTRHTRLALAKFKEMRSAWLNGKVSD